MRYTGVSLASPSEPLYPLISIIYLVILAYKAILDLGNIGDLV